MTSPEFLDVDDVLEIHDEQLAAFGGSTGLRDRGALESATAVPQATFGGQYLHEDLFAMAAAYAFHLAEAQAFADGNKRTGLVAALVFLRINGVRMDDPEERLYAAMIAIGTKSMTKADLAALFRELAALRSAT